MKMRMMVMKRERERERERGRERRIEKRLCWHAGLKKYRKHKKLYGRAPPISICDRIKICPPQPNQL